MTVSDKKTSEYKIVQTYHQEDIQQILQIAITRQAYQGEFSREQLVEIAAELEISPECLQVAEQEWLAQQADSQKRQEFSRYRRRKLHRRVGNYIIINTSFVLLSLLSGGSFAWLLYISLLWGLFLGLNVWNNYQSQGEEYERAFQAWYRKNQIQRTINNFLDRLFRS